jgi:CubicO group peptidase (beta-lactamase class C family)
MNLLRLLPLAGCALLLLGCGSPAGQSTPTGLAAATSPEAAGLSGERLQRLAAVLDGYAKEEKLAGSVAYVARRGQIVFHQAFGQRDREAGAPMQADSIFRIASQSKGVIAVATLMLVEEGRLLLTDPLGKYLPEFQDTTVAVPRPRGGYDVVKAKRPITVRDLLLHTSGLGYGTGPAADAWQKAGIQGYYFSDRAEPVGATVARMAALPMDAHPGEQWVYGYSFDVLGALIERVSGQGLDQFLEQRLFAPLGMRDTSFYLPEAKRDRLTAVYGRDAEGQLFRAPPDGSAGQGAFVDGPRQSFSGGAGLLSTAADYGRFLQMLLNQGEFEGRRYLSRKTVELMTSDHLSPIVFRPGVGEGLGFSVVIDLGRRGEPGSVGEFGWGGAYHSTYWVDPQEELVVVYLTQLIPAGDIDDFGKLRALIYQAIAD